MLSSAVLTFLSALPLTLTSPVPTPLTPRAYPANFTLTSSSTSPTYNNLTMTLYHIGAATAYAQLLPPGPDSNPISWYLNGTKVLFGAGSDGSIVEGLVVFDEDVPMEIHGGGGTSGFCLEDGKLKFETGSGFYACTNTTLPYGPGVQVFVSGGEVKEGCSAVELLATVP